VGVIAMHEAFVLTVQETCCNRRRRRFSVDDILTLLLNGMTVDQRLDVIQKRLIGMATPCPANWIIVATASA
jgi:hypothetical protein